MHLLNHLAHFPLAIGAARLSSLVVEQDDVPGLAADQLSAQVFSAPNIQARLTLIRVFKFFNCTCLKYTVLRNE